MKNMKTAKKLFVSFAVVVVLAVFVGVMGIYGMSSINSADDRLYNENVLAISAMGEIRETLQRERVIMRNAVLDRGNTDKVTEGWKTMSELERTIEENFIKYEATITDTSVESEYYTARDLYRGEYKQIKQNIYDASLKGGYEAYDLLFSQSVVSSTETMVNAFTVSMNNNIVWSEEAVDNNTSLFIRMTIIEIVVLLIAVIVAVILALLISSLISKPLSILTAFMQKAGTTGDITITPEDAKMIELYGANKDECGLCIASTANFMKHVNVIADELSAVSSGDLAIDIDVLSEKDVMGVSMKKMADNLNDMFSEINASTAQVTTGSKQIADGAQALAQGSTQQASAIEELSSSISEIADKTKTNADMAEKAANLAKTIMGSAEKGSRQMDEMMTAVKDINDASQNINKVIKVIDDIAFQTNILALNAAVEAARAGQHGKGFAVVAEEVRNLAAKSAEAAKDTGILIANSMEKAELGARIAEDTAVSLNEIVSGINESGKLVGDISKASMEQSSGISMINSGIDQVAQVVQQNSATAEESAAASEEMTGQATMLENLVSQFKLKNDGVSHYNKKSVSEKKPPKRLAMPAKATYGPHGDVSGDFGKY